MISYLQQMAAVVYQVELEMIYTFLLKMQEQT